MRRRLKPRFRLIWLFVLTAAVAFVTAFYARRQSALDAEIKSLEGVWESLAVNGVDCTEFNINFEDSQFKLIRPGLFEIELANKNVVYGIYKKDGNLLYYNVSYEWCACPSDIDDLLPAISWNAPMSEAHLYTADQRVTRFLLRLK